MVINTDIFLDRYARKKTEEQHVFFGQFEIIDNETIRLTGFGTAKFPSIQGDLATFELRTEIDDIPLITVSTTKADAIPHSPQTDLLCRSWELVSVDAETSEPYKVVFFNSGTYFGYLDEDLWGLGIWQWCNVEETKLAFTVYEELDCNGIEVLGNIQLTQNSFSALNYENESPELIVLQPLVHPLPTQGITHATIDLPINARFGL